MQRAKFALIPPLFTRTYASPTLQKDELKILANVDSQTSNSHSNIDSHSTTTKAIHQFFTSSYISHTSKPPSSYEKLSEILYSFKRSPIKYAIGYGSGVKKDNEMCDFIFGVSHVSHFHSLNLANRNSDYSSIKYFGSGAISFVQVLNCDILSFTFYFFISN